MSVTASLRESIMDNIVSTVAAIVADGSTYNFSIGECKLGIRRVTEVPEDLFPAAYLAGADEKRKNDAQRTFSSELISSLVVYVKTADAANKPQLERDLSKVISDITKALMVDVTRGGYAITTEIGDIDTDKGSFGIHAAAEIFVRCVYRASVTTT